MEQTRLRRMAHALAVQDWLLAGYLSWLLGGLLVAGPRSGRGEAVVWLGGLTVATLVPVGAVRAGWLSCRVAAVVYRVAMFGGIVGAYLLLRDILPIVSPDAYDRELRAIDAALFGADPVTWLVRFVTPARTEWFAFFYYAYFGLVAAYVFPTLLSQRESVTAELGLGIVFLYTVGHVLYTGVPAFGPYRAYPEIFATPLPSGPWLRALRRTVEVAGAQKDVFPSLHCAVPVYLTLFSYQRRRPWPLDVAWLVSLFVTVNIVVATVYLRWHYVIDVLAGVGFGLCVSLLTPRIARWESERRFRLGVGPVWPRWTIPAA